MDKDICDELLGEMKFVRNVLAGRYSWFTHDTPSAGLPKLRKEGLVPQRVSGAEDIIFQRIGPMGNHIACLYPVDCEVRPKSSGPPPYVRLGLASLDLPCRMGLDWSYDWNLARVIRHDYPQTPKDRIILDVARRRGSVVSYDGIERSRLRICRKSDSLEDPSTWPLLVDVSDAEVRLFDYAGTYFSGVI